MGERSRLERLRTSMTALTVFAWVAVAGFGVLTLWVPGAVTVVVLTGVGAVILTGIRVWLWKADRQ